MSDRMHLIGRTYVAARITFRVIREPVFGPDTVLVENTASKQRHWVERTLVEAIAEPTEEPV